MSAHVLLNLLNVLGKALFRNEFNKFNDTRARLSYDIKITLKFPFCHKKRYNFVIMHATLVWTS